MHFIFIFISTSKVEKNIAQLHIISRFCTKQKLPDTLIKKFRFWGTILNNVTTY